MFTFKAWLCFETLCRSQMPRQLVLKKMCQQTCHTHLRCQLPPEAESSLKTRDSRGCPAPTHLCGEPGRLGFFLPSFCLLLASHPSPCQDQPRPGLACPQQPLSTSPPPPQQAHAHLLQAVPCTELFPITPASGVAPQLPYFGCKALGGLTPASLALFLDFCSIISY